MLQLRPFRADYTRLGVCLRNNTESQYKFVRKENSSECISPFSRFCI